MRDSTAREYVSELRKSEDFDYRFLPDDHPVFDPNVPFVNFEESGLRSLLPGYLALAKRHDAAQVLEEAVVLLQLAIGEFRYGPKALRRMELAEDDVVGRATEALAEERGSVERMLRSAESPQEHP